jgi:copper transport protein
VPVLRRLVGLAIGVVALMLVSPLPAMAHPTLLFTEPAAETAVTQAPEAIVLVFGEQVSIGERAIILVRDDGTPVPTGEATTARDGHLVSAQLDKPLSSDITGCGGG